MTNFNEVWSRIYQHLAKGMQIRNWSNDGYTDKATTIEAVYFQEILVLGERGRAPRSVSREEFKRVFEYWGGYKDGRIDRTELEKRAQTQNTTYIFSILHWSEQQIDAL